MAIGLPGGSGGGGGGGTPSGGGLTAAQVRSLADARIRALVNALALRSDTTGRWPDARIAEDIARDTEVTAAVAPFLTRAQIEAQIASDVSDFLDQTAVDARVRALVNALFLVGDTGRIPDDRIAESIARDTEVVAAVAPFLTQTQIQALIDAAAIGTGNLDDTGEWTHARDYTALDTTRHEGAYYLAIKNSASGSAATTEPGVGTQWQSHWYRIGYESGPPNSIVDASVSGREITLTRESGEHPVEITLPAGTGSAYVFYTRPRLAVPDLSSQSISASDAGLVVPLLAATEIQGAVQADNPFFTKWEGAIRLGLSRGADLHIALRTTHSFNGKTLVHSREYVHSAVRDGDEVIPLGVFDSISQVALGTYTPPGGDPITITAEDLEGPTTIAYDLILTVTGKRTATREAATLNRLTTELAATTSYQLGAFDTGSTTVSFAPRELGTTTFNLDTTAGSVALTDSDGSAVIAPTEGFVLAAINAPSLGYSGQIFWMLAEDLRDAASDSEIAAGFYTDAQNRIFFAHGVQDAASSGNEIVLFAVGTTRDSSGDPTVRIRPSITEFRVTGEQHPVAGSIASAAYQWSSAISQTAHVSAARIVGFPGREENPSSVSVLATLTESQYPSASGTVTIPAGVSLTVGDAYTIRLEVYGEGETTSDPPVVYHDFYIVAVAATVARVHFGDIAVADGASDIVFADDDISTAGVVAGNWTISGIQPADGNRRLYWAVPAGLTQPTSWTENSFSITSSVEAAVTRTIDGADYRIYLTEADGPYTNFSNSTVITVA